MKRIWILSAALAGAALSGCALHPMNYQSGDHMAKAKGVLVHNSASATDSGLVLYSDNPKQHSVFGPKPAGNSTTQSSGGNTLPAAAPSQKAAPSANPPADYAQYQQFEQYQQFRKLNKNSSEYRQFQQWLQWKHYQEWKASQHSQ